MTATPPLVHLLDIDRDRLKFCNHYNPHEVLGWHTDGTHAVIRTRQMGAESVVAVTATGRVELQPIGDDFFSGALPTTEPVDYRLEVKWPGSDPLVIADPYHFLPTLGETDIYLISEGRHERLWEVLGANVKTYDTELGQVTGTAFAVWAPNAIGVAVVGDFNGWNAAQHPMRSLGSSGLWELFIPSVGAGSTYKFAIHTKSGQRIDKADPLAKRAELPPATASIVAESAHTWSDERWLARRRDTDHTRAPMSVYEVHLGSWNMGKNYHELARDLVQYVSDMGYTHVEFMPVAEHPFGGSWGYQVSGYYAPSARFGDPDGLRHLIDAFHQANIGVIIDWVPAHFPKDEFSLGRFDGAPVYEHPDWRRGEQTDWGTYVFDFGRPEVRNFLVANALYWAEEFHVDGLRVDAVASMLYLDYSRKDGEWEPNQFGGREHLEAVQFLQEMNATVHRQHPGIVTIAEESTSWPGVTARTDMNGLGFTMKWNMGWMHDTLEYFSKDPAYRQYHHGEITFSMVYAYSEKYVLPISHDEVVHGKGTLWTRMPGDAWNKAAGVRTLLAYMWAHPGKQLLFMGQDFAQVREWSEARSLDWSDTEGWEGEYHQGVMEQIRAMNAIYKDTPALYTQDSEPSGFGWAKADDAGNNILAFHRYGDDGSKLLCVLNLGGTSQPEYTLGMPEGGRWELVLNTDAGCFAGANNGLGDIESVSYPWDGYEFSAQFHIPAMSAQWYRWAPGQA